MLESGETKYTALGVVFKDYYTILRPGLDGTVGYQTKDKKIYMIHLGIVRVAKKLQVCTMKTEICIPLINHPPRITQSS